MTHQVGENLKPQGQILGPEAQRDAGRGRLQRSPDVLDRGGQLKGRAAARSLLQQPAGQVGNPWPGFADRPGIDVKLNGNHARPAAALGE